MLALKYWCVIVGARARAAAGDRRGREVEKSRSGANQPADEIYRDIDRHRRRLRIDLGLVAELVRYSADLVLDAEECSEHGGIENLAVRFAHQRHRVLVAERFLVAAAADQRVVDIARRHDATR